MPHPDDFTELTATLEERRRYFTPRWFADLLGARLSLGDTFWIGSYGTALVLVPVTVLFVLATRLALPPAQADVLLGLLLAVEAIFYLALLRAVVLTALPRHDTGGWRWWGVALAAVNALLTAGMAFGFLWGGPG